jgi:nucleoside-diphosphate-sugar epimerase
MRCNSEGTLNLLNLALQQEAVFLEASTSEVYGDPLEHPQNEGYLGNVNPIGPRSCYDESKRYAEALTMSYRQKFNLDTKIVRIFNTYGPGMRPDDGRVIPNFINQVLRGEDLTVYGDGTQTRSFCYVDDLIEAISLVVEKGDETPYNCGNAEEVSILECAQQVIRALDGKSKIVFRELPKDDPQRRRPDLTKIKELGDFRPKVSFEQGIKKTAAYFRSL